MHNILPAHVAEIYINQQLSFEFYNEEYENVAILFATITNFETTSDASIESEKGCLNVLNEIICDFDEVLLSHHGPQKIEKIKVAGWTYMVACGLDPGRGDSSFSFPTNGLAMISPSRTSNITTTGRRSHKPIRKCSVLFCKILEMQLSRPSLQLTIHRSPRRIKDHPKMWC